jgi:hypothetical protein
VFLDCWSSVVRLLGHLRPLAAIFVRADWRNKTRPYLMSRGISSPGAGANVASPRGFLMWWLVSVSNQPISCEGLICTAWFCTPSC